MHDKQKYALMLSRQQLINVRRVLNRGVDCAEGRCPQNELTCTWWCIKAVIDQLQELIKQSVVSHSEWVVKTNNGGRGVRKP